MQLNLPILDSLRDSQSILIAGAGGGFDVFCGLPIYFTLREMGKMVHLANYSFTNLDIVSHYCQTTILEDSYLVGAQAGVPSDFNLSYYPEGYLSRWFKTQQNEDITIWMFDRTGAKTLIHLYQILIDHLKIDAIVLIDGGIDSLTRGDETGAGTFLEDAISLCAIDTLNISTKILACLGFGAELEVCHYLSLENMAGLVQAGAFLGSCALTPHMPVYQHYESASRYVWEQPSHHKSQINMRIVSATNGEFGDNHLYDDYEPLKVFVSPLMSLYWFFDAPAVIERSLIVDAIRDTRTIKEAHEVSIQLRKAFESKARQHRVIPY